VRLLALGKAAEVLALSDNGQELTVRCGVLRSTVPLEAIEGLNGEKPAPPEPPQVRVRGGTALAGQGAQVRTTRNTVDVRGLRVHEAEAAVEEILRAASGPVWVIHGHGTGKLKRGLREWLEGVPYVERVVGSEAAAEMLSVAGFKPALDDDTVLQLSHNNAALLTLAAYIRWRSQRSRQA
jgi:DNA mismatch repair protein MutS2